MIKRKNLEQAILEATAYYERHGVQSWKNWCFSVTIFIKNVSFERATGKMIEPFLLFPKVSDSELYNPFIKWHTQGFGKSKISQTACRKYKDFKKKKKIDSRKFFKIILKILPIIY